MKIIGGKDYYDHGLAYGVDESVRFVRVGTKIRDRLFHVRNTGSFPSMKLPEPATRRRTYLSDDRNKWEWKHKGITHEAELVHVILCGHYFSGVRVWWHGFEHEPSQRKDWHSETFWDQNNFGKFLSKRGGRLIPPDPRRRRAVGHWDREDRLRPFDRRKLDRDELSWVIDNGIVVATRFDFTTDKFEDKTRAHDRIRDDYVWDVNSDTLKDVDFIKVVDPVTAFQEISMWVGGVLPSDGPKMVEITDPKVVIHKHGFDLKTSFRHPIRIPVKKRKQKETSP